MAKNLSRPNSGFQSPKPPVKGQAQAKSTDAPKPKPKNYYFDNPLVETLMTQYVQGGCTDVDLRDEIMSHAEELIKQIIRTHRLHLIGAGKDGATFFDLYQLAWVQIESSLYKFNYGPGHTKVFNMWSQVAKTVMLAHIKKESRDRRNYGSYKEHLGHRFRISNPKFERFIEEAEELFKYNEGHLKIVDALKELAFNDPRPHEGLICKLVERTRLPRARIVNFLRLVRLRCLEFSDAPVNDVPKPCIKGTDESEDESEI